MRKSIFSLTAALVALLSCQSGIAIADDHIAEDVSLSSIADSLGAKTDLLNIPNYYHDEERPIPEASYKEWLSKATNVEYAINSLQTFNSAAAKGNCLGITMIEVLCHNGVISPSDVQPNAETLSDVVYDDDINKLLTDYQALQVHTEYELFDHYLITALTYDEQVDRTLRIAEDCMENGRYFALFFQTHKMFHAVTGMGIVDGSWQFGENKYDRCILTHDSNGTDSEGNTGFNEKGCIYLDSSTHHIYIPAYDIDSDDEMLIGAIDDDTLLNYKGAISPSDHTDRNVSDIKKITLNSASRLRYDLNFIKDGISVPLGDYLTGLSSRIYYTKADKIVSKAEKQWDSEVTNSITIQDTVAKCFYETYEKPSVISIKDNVCSITSTDDESLRWRIQYYLNKGNEPEHSNQYSFCLAGYSSDIDISQEKNGFLIKGDISGKYSISTEGIGYNENGERETPFGNQYIYYFNAVQDVLIAYDDKSELGLYIDPDHDGVFTDKVKAGDINCDGRIDATDASEILSKYSWLSTHYDLFLDLSQTNDSLDLNFMNYDYNGDGKINASDASEVLMEYSRMSTI